MCGDDQVVTAPRGIRRHRPPPAHVAPCTPAAAQRSASLAPKHQAELAAAHTAGSGTAPTVALRAAAAPLGAFLAACDDYLDGKIGYRTVPTQIYRADKRHVNASPKVIRRLAVFTAEPTLSSAWGCPTNPSSSRDGTAPALRLTA